MESKNSNPSRAINPIGHKRQDKDREGAKNKAEKKCEDQ